MTAVLSKNILLQIPELPFKRKQKMKWKWNENKQIAVM